MLVGRLVESELTLRHVPSALLGRRNDSGPSAHPLSRFDEAGEGPRLEASALGMSQLARAAEDAVRIAAPTSPVLRRSFDLADRRILIFAARVPHGRRAPREPGLIRLALELGTGLQLRAIGGLAIVAIEVPFVAESLP